MIYLIFHVIRMAIFRIGEIQIQGQFVKIRELSFLGFSLKIDNLDLKIKILKLVEIQPGVS